MTKTFSFKISPSVLNPLGRDLYRNFITVLGEAISNSWDAEAKNIWIEINEAQSCFLIKDDGRGMNDTDFQEKFLNVGYSKRDAGEWISPHKKRPYIGRKGIGKIALLSCAQRVHILSKTSDKDYIGGIIDNEELNKTIKSADNTETAGYKLAPLEKNIFEHLTNDHKHGTILYLENMNEGRINKIDTLKRLIALHFRFSLIDPSFSIFVNGAKISFYDLKELSNNTQFSWTINEFKDPFLETLGNKKEHDNIPVKNENIKGFIASVAKPSNLNILGSGEKIGIDVFVNGRLRETNILRYMPVFTARHIASYLYGQIHLDILDDKNSKSTEDIFQTSREGIKPDSKIYQRLLETIKNEILTSVSDQWSQWRKKDKSKIPTYLRALDTSQNDRIKYFAKMIDSLKNLDDATKTNLKIMMDKLPSTNTQVYQDLFILENLFREFLKERGIKNKKTLQNKFPEDAEVKKCIAQISKTKDYREEDEAGHILEGGIVENEHDSNYLSLVDLGILIDRVNGNTTGRHTPQTMEAHIKDIVPVRNAVMHTNQISKKVMSWPKIEKLIKALDKLETKP